MKSSNKEFIRESSFGTFVIIDAAYGWNNQSKWLIKKYPQHQIQFSYQNGKSSTPQVVSKLNDGIAALQVNDKNISPTYYVADNKVYIRVYARILIRNKGW